MKKLFTSLAVVILLTFAQFAHADTANYYVINGEPFTLTPAGGSSLSKLIWTIDLTDIQEILGTASGGVLTHTFSDATSTIKLHKISLKVLEVVGGCLSDAVDYNIIVLPKITVSITPPTTTNYCVGTLPNLDLVASVSVVSNLVDFGVTISPFTWKNGAVALSETSGTLHVNSAGVYTAVVSYVLPTGTATYLPTASKLLNAVTGATQTILNNLPLPGVPAITLN